MIMRLVAGSGRSGTTWVLDALAAANKLRPVFEPLHPLVSRAGELFAHRTLAAGEEQPELRRLLDGTIFDGDCALWTKYRRLGHWLAPPFSEIMTSRGFGQLYRRWKKFLQDSPQLAMASMRSEPLVKCIHANLMLGWLSWQYNFRIVLIVRHPGAVIESEMRGGWNPAFALDRFRTDPRLRDLTGNRYTSLLTRALSPVEGLAARWVIENQVALEEAATGKTFVSLYERLKQSPESEWMAICEAMDLTHIPTQQAISRPSQQSAAVSSSAGDEAVESPRWMTALSAEQLDQIQSVLDEVGFDLYTMKNAFPQVRPAAVIRNVSPKAIQ